MKIKIAKITETELATSLEGTTEDAKPFKIQYEKTLLDKALKLADETITTIKGKTLDFDFVEIPVTETHFLPHKSATIIEKAETTYNGASQNNSRLRRFFTWLIKYV